MKRNLLTKLLIVLFALSAAAAFAGCNDANTVSATVDLVLTGRRDTLDVEAGAAFYGDLMAVQLPETDFEFGGYYLGGEAVTESTTAPDHDFTVTARWLVSYSEEHWLEQTDGSFALDSTLTRSSKDVLGATVTAEAKEIPGYAADPAAAGSVTTATLDRSGIVLKVYYKIADYALTFDKGLAAAATGEMASLTGKYNAQIKLPACGFVSATAEFVGYNTSKDNSGTSYRAGDTFSLRADATLYAIWNATVTQTVYVEEDSNSGNFVKGGESSFPAIVGSTAQCRNPDESKYSACEHDGAVPSGTVAESGLALTGYYELKTFTVTYADDNTTQSVVWGQTFTVRTPENTDPTQKVVTYCTSRTGNGRDYAFGSEFVVKEDITLYPVIEDIYTDDAESGDTVKVRRNMTGLGAATLVRGGAEYRGFLEINEDAGTAEFSVEIDGETVYGRLYNSEAGDQLFRYRGEEAGTFLYLDPLYFSMEYGYESGVNMFVMLALDGYGTGVLAMPEQGGDRFENYACTYEYNETTDDYYLHGVFPGTGAEVEMYFALVIQSVDIGDGYTADGFFMEYDFDFVGPYFYYYNQALGDLRLELDGYGNAALYEVIPDPETDDEELELLAEGIIFHASFDEGDPEMVFLPDSGDGSFGEGFYFILQTLSVENERIGLFLIRQNEMGDYTHRDGLSTLHLDGYGGAYYSPDGSTANEQEGFYTIQRVEGTEDSYTVIISFLGGQGQLALNIDLSERTFSVFEDGFVVEEGVLTQYLGTNSIIEIPEGVTEIADGVFKDLTITSVTFPTTLERIGDHAFENSSVSGGSSIKTVVFKSQTPPTLGADVFRWIKGNFKIYVPDGCEAAYRAAFATPTASQPDGYAKFVTSEAEQNNKPEFEVQDGVLVSYNNKDADPQNVSVVIPEGVTEIADGVFNGIPYIVSVDLSGVTKIGKNAFRGCSALASVTFGETVESIGDSAFYGCALTEVELFTVGSVETLAFARNFGLVKVTFGSVESIAAQAFYECARITDEQETEVTALEFVITIHGEPPVLEGLAFDGVLSLRVYVDSFETGVKFAAEGSGWQRYAVSLRVKAEEAETWYDLSNPAAKLEIGDRIMFNETYFGLYERVEGGFNVCWFEFNALSATFTYLDNHLRIEGGRLVGMDVSDIGDSNTYIFAEEGATRTYVGRTTSGESLFVTFGSTAGKFCGEDITFDYSHYRTGFTYQGYIYAVTFYGDLTFTYTKTKVVVTRSYTAEDGSTITIDEGDSIYANGILKNVNGITGPNGNGLEMSTSGWYLTKLSDTVYTFKASWRSDNYAITIRIESDTTFSYTWELASEIVVFTDGNGNIAVVTRQKDRTVSSIHILFKTSNGSEEVIAAFVKEADGSYTLTVNATVEDPDEQGNVTTRPSDFNGTYTLILNEEDKTFTLTQN